MNEVASPRRFGVAVAVAAGLAIAFSCWRYLDIMSSSPQSSFDDSYMFTRYAKHILGGYGHAWNAGGEQTYGITSLLYVLVITGLKWLTDYGDADLLRTTSSGIGLGALIVMVLTASRFTKTTALSGNQLLWAAIFIPITLQSGPFIYHALTGMDTMLAVFMHSVLIYVTLRMVELGTARALWPVVLASYLAFLTRPDSAIYAGLFPAAAILLLTDPTRRIGLLVKFWLALGAVILIDTGVKYAIFGIPIPLPTYAKMQGHYDDYAGLWRWNSVEFLFNFLGVALPFICILIGFAKRRRLSILLVFLVPAALTLASYFQVVQIMGYQGRFNLPSLPFFVIAAALCLDRFFLELKELPATLEVVSRIMAMFLALALVPLARDLLAPMHKDRLVRESPPTIAPQNPGNLPPVDYFDAVAGMAVVAVNAPEGSLFCMSEYGKLGSYAPDLDIFDPLGLHDPQTAREDFSATVLLERAPDLIWMPHTDYVGMRREILAAEKFQNDYDFYPAAFNYGVAIRKSGERSAKIRQLFAYAFFQCYPDIKLKPHLLTR